MSELVSVCVCVVITMHCGSFSVIHQTFTEHLSLIVSGTNVLEQ